jgi:hypothetical protein
VADAPCRTKTFEKCLVLGVGLNITALVSHRHLANKPGYFPEMPKWLRSQVYDTALRQQPTLSYQILEARVFVEIMLAMSAIKDKSPLDETNLRLINQTGQ